MPRNPDKTRCQIPGCRNWAMRGHSHCRSHRDSQLGPRGAGAPPGNLSALRTGHDAHPLSPSDLDRLAHAIIRTPDQLPHHLHPLVQSIHRRSGDPVKTLLALQALLPALLSRVAEGLFTSGFHAYLEQLPPDRRSPIEIAIWRLALQISPLDKLKLLRQLQRRRQAAAKDAPTPP